MSVLHRFQRLLFKISSWVLAQDSPNKHGVMGSKSVGEPPLLLSTSVLTAFQAAIAAAKEGLAARALPPSAAAADGGGAPQLRICACSCLL